MRQAKRRRGGQPGNVNAVKHGRYSRQLRDVELAADALRIWAPDVFRVSNIDHRRREQMARALRIAADLLVAYPRGTIDEIAPLVILKATQKVKNEDKRKDEQTNRIQKPQKRLDGKAAQNVE
jgi:hypothetical protein